MANALSNTQILKSIGLPATIANEVATAQGDTYVAKANEVLSALVNKIVYQRVEYMEFDNPFKKYDGFPVEYGDTIENIFVDTQLGEKFDKDATDPFKKTGAVVKSTYSHINYEMQYPITIEDKLMKRCCLSEFGLMRLVDVIVSRLAMKSSVDEYLGTIIMLNNKDIYAKGFEEIDVSKATTDAEKYKIVAKTMGNVSDDMALPSIDNNKMGVMNVTGKDRQLLIIKQTLLRSIDMDYLAGVFNLSKIDLLKNIIPVRSFKAVINTSSGATITPSEKGDDIDFVILDERGFDNHVALQDGGSIYNPKGKYINYFLNLWKIISYRYDFQARAFKLKTVAA